MVILFVVIRELLSEIHGLLTEKRMLEIFEQFIANWISKVCLSKRIGLKFQWGCFWFNITAVTSLAGFQE